MTYEIFEVNMERLEAKLTRIANKCKKYGCEFTYKKTGEVYRELIDENKQKYTARFIQVEAEGTAIINDWQFIASVEHTEKGNIINRVCDIEVPERYYMGSPVCEHCNSSRYRKYTYIVRNVNNGEFKQVGKSCLNDFTHGLSAEAAARYISLYDCLIAGETPEPGFRFEHYIELKEALQYIAETINKFGYVKTQDCGRSTASRAHDYYLTNNGMIPSYIREDCKREMEEVNFDHTAPKVLDTVSKALDWVLSQDETNNYMHNLKTICSLPYVRQKNFGILASLFPSHNRELAYQAKKEAEAKANAAEVTSEYVGTIKDRITVEVKSVTCVTSWGTDFGITRIYKIIGTDGNVYMWKTGNLIEDTIKTITGTVKAHNEFRGIKQTELTRCRVAA